MPEPTAPKNVDTLPVEERALQLTTQINEMQVKLNAKDATEQTEAELDEVAELYKQIEALYEPEYLPGDIAKGEISLMTSNGLWVQLPGTKMRAIYYPKTNEFFGTDTTYEFKVMGIKEYAPGENIIILEWLPEKKRQTEFEGIVWNKYKITEELERYGLKVGQEARIKTILPPGVELMEKIRKAKNLTITGFTKDGKIVIQMDGDKVIVNSIKDYNNCYEVVE